MSVNIITAKFAETDFNLLMSTKEIGVSDIIIPADAKVPNPTNGAENVFDLSENRSIILDIKIIFGATHFNGKTKKYEPGFYALQQSGLAGFDIHFYDQDPLEQKHNIDVDNLLPAGSASNLKEIVQLLSVEPTFKTRTFLSQGELNPGNSNIWDTHPGEDQVLDTSDDVNLYDTAYSVSPRSAGSYKVSQKQLALLQKRAFTTDAAAFNTQNYGLVPASAFQQIVSSQTGNSFTSLANYFLHVGMSLIDVLNTQQPEMPIIADLLKKPSIGSDWFSSIETDLFIRAGEYWKNRRSLMTERNIARKEYANQFSHFAKLLHMKDYNRQSAKNQSGIVNSAKSIFLMNNKDDMQGAQQLWETKYPKKMTVKRRIEVPFKHLSAGKIYVLLKPIVSPPMADTTQAYFGSVSPSSTRPGPEIQWSPSTESWQSSEAPISKEIYKPIILNLPNPGEILSNLLRSVVPPRLQFVTNEPHRRRIKITARDPGVNNWTVCKTVYRRQPGNYFTKILAETPIGNVNLSLSSVQSAMLDDQAVLTYPDVAVYGAYRADLASIDYRSVGTSIICHGKKRPYSKELTPGFISITAINGPHIGPDAGVNIHVTGIPTSYKTYRLIREEVGAPPDTKYSHFPTEIVDGYSAGSIYSTKDLTTQRNKRYRYKVAVLPQFGGEVVSEGICPWSAEIIRAFPLQSSPFSVSVTSEVEVTPAGDQKIVIEVTATTTDWTMSQLSSLLSETGGTGYQNSISKTEAGEIVGFLVRRIHMQTGVSHYLGLYPVMDKSGAYSDAIFGLALEFDGGIKFQIHDKVVSQAFDKAHVLNPSPDILATIGAGYVPGGLNVYTYELEMCLAPPEVFLRDHWTSFESQGNKIGMPNRRAVSKKFLSNFTHTLPSTSDIAYLAGDLSLAARQDKIKHLMTTYGRTGRIFSTQAIIKSNKPSPHITAETSVGPMPMGGDSGSPENPANSDVLFIHWESINSGEEGVMDAHLAFKQRHIRYSCNGGAVSLAELGQYNTYTGIVEGSVSESSTGLFSGGATTIDGVLANLRLCRFQVIYVYEDLLTGESEEVTSNWVDVGWKENSYEHSQILGYGG